MAEPWDVVRKAKTDKDVKNGYAFVNESVGARIVPTTIHSIQTHPKGANLNLDAISSGIATTILTT